MEKKFYSVQLHKQGSKERFIKFAPRKETLKEMESFLEYQFPAVDISTYKEISKEEFFDKKDTTWWFIDNDGAQGKKWDKIAKQYEKIEQLGNINKFKKFFKD